MTHALVNRCPPAYHLPKPTQQPATLLESFNQPASLKLVLLAMAIGVGAVVVKERYFKPLTLDTPPAYSIDAGDLLIELGGNQAAAHLKYKDKVIEVTGKMRGVRMQGNTPVITIGNMIAFNLECHLPPDKTANAARLQGGADMRVRGVARLSGSSVHLSPCTY